MSDAKNNNDLANPVSPPLCNVTQPELAKTETAAGRTHLVTGTFFIGFRKRNDLNMHSVVLQFTMHGSAVPCTS